VVIDHGHSRNRPSGALRDFTLVPSLDLSFERHPIVVYDDADATNFKFGVSFLSVEDLGPRILRLRP